MILDQVILYLCSMLDNTSNGFTNNIDLQGSMNCSGMSNKNKVRYISIHFYYNYNQGRTV